MPCSKKKKNLRELSGPHPHQPKSTTLAGEPVPSIHSGDSRCCSFSEVAIRPITNQNRLFFLRNSPRGPGAEDSGCIFFSRGRVSIPHIPATARQTAGAVLKQQIPWLMILAHFFFLHRPPCALPRTLDLAKGPPQLACPMKTIAAQYPPGIPNAQGLVPASGLLGMPRQRCKEFFGPAAERGAHRPGPGLRAQLQPGRPAALLLTHPPLSEASAGPPRFPRPFLRKCRPTGGPIVLKGGAALGRKAISGSGPLANCW